MERTFGFIQNLLGCSSHHNGTCLPQCHTRETKQLCEKGRKEHCHIHPFSPSQIPPTSSLLEHPPFPPNLILMLSHPPTNLKTHSLPNPSSHLLTLSSPIMTSSMSLQCPSFTLSGLPNVDTISPPRSETLQSCYSVCHLSVEDGSTHAHY